MSQPNPLPPEYSEAENTCKPLRFRIISSVNHKTQKRHFEVSDGSVPVNTPDVHHVQRYNVQNIDSDTFSITEPDTTASIKCLTTTKEIRFELSTSDNRKTMSERKEIHVPKVKRKDTGALLEQTQQVQFDFSIDSGLATFIWRVAPSQRKTLAPQDINSSDGLEIERRMIDLVLLDEGFQQQAYFASNPSFAESSLDGDLGVLDVMGSHIGDACFLEQIILSALTLLELHIRLSEQSDKRADNFAENVMLTVASCVVM